ncbi:unnamed protein product, partial [Didymodactylos carnosus]
FRRDIVGRRHHSTRAVSDGQTARLPDVESIRKAAAQRETSLSLVLWCTGTDANHHQSRKDRRKVPAAGSAIVKASVHDAICDNRRGARD